MAKLIIFLALSVLPMSRAFAQSQVYHDIEDIHLKNMLSESDSTSILKFQNFAIRLFMEGSSVNEAYFKGLDEKIIGVCLMKDTNQVIEFNLYALNYMDIAPNWPVTAGSKGIAGFYVKCNNNKEKSIVKQAVDSYLNENRIPVNNQAYQFCNDYQHSGNQYEPIYETDGISAVMPEIDYSLYRRNGNYIIEIIGETNDSEQENFTPGDYFSKHWLAITVYIVDQTSGKAYGQQF